MPRSQGANKTLLPPGLVLLSILSTQTGSALATGLFPALGPVGTVGLRVAWAALLLLIVWHPPLKRAYGWRAYGLTALFGCVLGGMNLSFYLALSQIPLGITVTIEFVGPLALAVILSRRAIDLLWVLFAVCGLLLLTPFPHTGTASLSLVGMGLALLAGTCWALYVLLSSRVGRIFPGGSGLALATLFATLVLLPAGILQARTALLNPWLLLAGAGVGLLSTALPYSLEMEALRSLPSRVFSILLSLEPAVAALIGFLLLHETLSWQALLALVLISLASVGVLFTQKAPT